MRIASAFIALFGCAGLGATTPVTPRADAATPLGQWSPLLPLPLSPISGGISPTGEILLFSGNSPGGWLFTNGGGNWTYYVVVSTDQLLNRKPIPLQGATTSEMFCPGTTNMPDGRILVNGGSGPVSAIMYDPAKKTFGPVASMNVPRGYQANVLTTNNKVFTIGGSFVKKYGKYGFGGRDGELYTPDVNGLGSWAISNPKSGNIIGGMEDSPSPDPEGIYRSDNHAWLVSYKSAAGDDMVLHLGPVKTMHNINTSKGTLTSLGPRGTDSYAINGGFVQYSPGRVFKTGGATAYGNSQSSVGLAASKATYTIRFDTLPTGGAVQVRQNADMHNARTFCHSIVLPGGKIFVVGGQTNIHIFEDTNGVLTPELYDPGSGVFTVLPAMQKARTYHSIALLTKDGTVLVGGGGAKANKCSTPGKAPCTDAVHFDSEIYTPPNLTTGLPRPVITKLSTGTPAPYNAVLLPFQSPLTILATSCGNGCTYELLRLSSATHSVTNDQLRVPLQVTKRDAVNGDVAQIYRGDLPFVTGGYYYLFAISGQGVPSVAGMVKVVR
ncbi:uncharacterized protein EV422DRAFT_97624 [Fimicolochytrium jonesii]|uniref:uncharacterized protein n=1 Tax=Fimicolochytrium jonesii TaxID=1396493 RepID=UPI0022FEBFEB|nr:uncharacterized protein EV422DRAFT_97624 [Fimicolochytrium jonesii]KAI8819573.1 hypothetical protein EV422DRAFT_97624 [Fimicolochytrium jonesii]